MKQKTKYILFPILLALLLSSCREIPTSADSFEKTGSARESSSAVTSAPGPETSAGSTSERTSQISADENSSPDGTISSDGMTGQAVPEAQPSEAADASSAEELQISEAAVVPSMEGLLLLADELGEKYGVDILCGSDVPRTYADYTADLLTDPEAVLAALHVIDDVLALYPPSFFPSVCEGYCDSIRICLARDLQAVDDRLHMEYVNAFATVRDDTIWLVVNAEEPVRRSTLIHELTHVVDYRLLGMNQLRESEWNQLNPEGFSYYNAYLDKDGNDYRITGSREYTSFTEKDPARIYFYDPYSRTYAMEDRARLMEMLLEDDGESAPDRCFSSSHIQTKLRFYFYTLRQAFENGRWPEETAWEAAFRRVTAHFP